MGPPPYTTLVFEVKNIKTKLPNLVAWLIDFQNTPLLQRIKRLTIRKSEEAKDIDQLKVDVTIEAIIVQGATKRPKTLLGLDERLVALNTIATLPRGSRRSGAGAVDSRSDRPGGAGPEG